MRISTACVLMCVVGCGKIWMDEAPIRSYRSANSESLKHSPSALKESSIEGITPSNRARLTDNRIVGVAVLSPDRVARAQEALNAHGYPLRVDGVMGRTTSEALKAFQRQKGLKVTGFLDRSTLAKLGVS